MDIWRTDVQPIFKAYGLTITTVIIAYDFLCTLDQEITYVWSRPWSLGSCLFFMNRYLPFVDAVIALNLMRSVTTPEMCHNHHLVYIWFATVGVFLSEVILMLRTYAMWNRARPILIGLSILAIFTFATLLTVVIVGTTQLKFGPVVEFRYGCNVEKAENDIAGIYYLVVCLSETIIVILTMIKAFEHRHSHSSWVHQIYRDGVLFYIFMLVITVANVAVTFTSNVPQFRNILALPQRDLHSVLCNRVILLILAQRAIHDPDIVDDIPLTMRGASEVLSTMVETRNAESVEDASDLQHLDWTH